MVSYVRGDLLETKAEVICHQVNLQGFMGGGLAYSIAKRFPRVSNVYEKYEPKKMGEVCFVKTPFYVVANCFSQDKGFNTNYDAVRVCMDKVKNMMSLNGYTRVAIPYKYGCGIANGEWEKVYEIVEDVFKDYDLLIYKL